jgi:hypothetical protein
MPHLSLTRLRLRSVRYLPALAWHTSRSTRQLRRSPGYLGGELMPNFRHLVFWTVTLWESTEAMRRFRNTSAHMRAMPKLLRWCDEAAVAGWDVTETALPSYDALRDRMARQGRTSKVSHPSEAQLRGNTVGDGRSPRLGFKVPAKR